MNRRHTEHALLGFSLVHSSRRWACFSMTYGRSLLLTVLLAGCHSTQDVYLAQATDHARGEDIALAFGQPSYEQVLGTGQRLWLYRHEGKGIESRDVTPFCQDLWLTFDREGVLRNWQKQRC